MTTEVEIDWIERAAAAGVSGFLHPNEAAKLVELATGRDVLEVGSFKGLSAWCMAHTAKSVTCVDTFKANDAGQIQMEDLTTYQAFRRAIDGFPNVSFFVGTSEEAAGRASGSKADLIFLDAMHTYEDVRADIARWWPRLRSGGVLALHDYGHDHFPGVKQAVDERFGPAQEGETVVTLRWVVKP